MEKKNKLKLFEHAIVVEVPSNNKVVLFNKFVSDPNKCYKVKNNGWRFVLPWQRIEGYADGGILTIDFDKQVIDVGSNGAQYDIIVDTEIQIKLNDEIEIVNNRTGVVEKYNENVLINSKNKELRRAFHNNNPAKIVVIDRHNDAKEIKDQINVYVNSILRESFQGMDFVDIKNIKFNDLTDPLVQEITSKISEKINTLGYKLIDFSLKDVQQSQKIDEINERLKVAESEAKIKEIETDVESYRIRTIGEAEAYAIGKKSIAEEQGKITLNQKNAKIYADMDANQIAALNGNEVKNVNVNMPNLGTIANSVLGSMQATATKQENQTPVEPMVTEEPAIVEETPAEPMVTEEDIVRNDTTFVVPETIINDSDLFTDVTVEEIEEPVITEDNMFNEQLDEIPTVTINDSNLFTDVAVEEIEEPVIVEETEEINAEPKLEDISADVQRNMSRQEKLTDLKDIRDTIDSIVMPIKEAEEQRKLENLENIKTYGQNKR